MKMTKKLVQRAVLLLTFVLLFTLVAATAALAGESDPMMTVTFNPEECKVLLTYTGLAEPIVMESDVGVSVPYGYEVTVTVIPELGYELHDIQDLDHPGNSLKSLYEDSYHTASFLSSVRAEIICSTSVFNVKFEQAGVTKLPYNPESGNTADLAGLKYYYMQPDNKTVLPTVVRSGYTFQYWQVIKSNGEEVQKITTKTEDGKFYIPSEIINQDMVDNGTIYLHAEFTANPQKVTRYDYVYNTALGVNDKLLGSYEWECEMDAWISGLTQMGDDAASDDSSNPYLNYKSYPGYRLYTEGNYPLKQVTMPTAQNPNPNVFNRLYVPVVYTLVYENLVDGTLPAGAPMTYTYDEHTQILQPTRRGYTFTGWIVVVDGVEIIDAEHAALDFVLGNKGAGNAEFAAKNEQITLIATWQANTYSITYDWNVSEGLIADMNAWNAALPKTFTFNTPDFFINNPFRKGYTFTGWTLSCACADHESGSVVGLNPGEGKTQLDCAAHAGNITLTAHWEAENYTVILDGQGGDEGYTTQIGNVKYDQALTIPESFVLPQKLGYTFGGYWSAPNGGGTQYIDKNGNSVCASWNIDGEEGGTITLYAYWIINQYNVVFNSITGLPAGTSVTIKIIVDNVPYGTFNEFPVSVELDYNTTFKVEISILDAGFRLVKWNGEEITDYLGITFTSGDITLGAEDIVLTAEARPAKPNIGAGHDVDVTLESETEIKVDFKDAETAQKYEVAISGNQDATDLDWKQVAPGETQYIFTELDPGTKYYVFVRLSKTETTLEGISAVTGLTTNYYYFVQNTENFLKDMIGEDDGDCVKALINVAIQDIRDLIPENGELPADFNKLVEDIVASVEQKIAFARFQDSKSEELQKYFNVCLNSGAFRQENLAKIADLCAVAVAQISAASTEEEVNALFDEAMVAMKAVPATYLFGANNDVTLESLLGMNFGGSIQLNSIQDINALRRAIADAIAQGKITAYSSITIEEATKLLRALDTVSAYNFSLINVQVSEGDVFTITLTIPEALINCTGLQVAYFNQITGMVELLETSRVGNTLVFKANYIADFVILADPTVDLTAVIIALGVILFCQLLAIALVLIARSKARDSVMHASVALPMFLTIHFLPVANAELIALGLGLGVVVAQIVLMWLLLSSGMIRVFKFKRRTPEQKEVTAVVREEDLQESVQVEPEEEPVEQVDDVVADDIVDEVVTEVIDDFAEELIEEAAVEEIFEEPAEELVEEAADEQVLDEDAFDQELAEELAAEQNEEYVEEEYANEAYDEGDYEDVAQEALAENTEEVYDDEEFIAEETPEDYYSTDEEENVYAYNQEEAERVSDEIETDQETEETTYDADPFADVFGESDESDGDSANEEGNSGYADSYGEAYEYDDGSVDSYAETEDADREETSGQGQIDSTSYIVNDEEISEEEEMYQYDE